MSSLPHLRLFFYSLAIIEESSFLFPCNLDITHLISSQNFLSKDFLCPIYHFLLPFSIQPPTLSLYCTPQLITLKKCLNILSLHLHLHYLYENDFGLSNNKRYVLTIRKSKGRGKWLFYVHIDHSVVSLKSIELFLPLCIDFDTLPSSSDDSFWQMMLLYSYPSGKMESLSFNQIIKVLFSLTGQIRSCPSLGPLTVTKGMLYNDQLKSEFLNQQRQETQYCHNLF